MRQHLAAILAAVLLLTGCQGSAPAEAPPSLSPSAQAPAAVLPEPEEPKPPEPEPDPLQTLLDTMTLPEKVGQLFFVRCPAENAAADVETYHPGGYILFGRDFQNAAGGWLTEEQLTETLQSYQDAAAIPLLIGVDEEGGTVVRASRNPNLFPGGKFHSPQWISRHGGDFAADAREKSAALLALGINVNLAPVCDVSTNPGSFIYDRTLGQDAAATADYVESVVTAMRDCGIGSVLKHFPGYGNNPDTHTGIAVDERPLESFLNQDFLPFQAGITAGGDTTAVLVSHNIISHVDDWALPASLSPAVHDLLRKDLSFDGVVMTDDLAMDAVAKYAENGAVALMALQAGNDMIITSDYRMQIPLVIKAVEAGDLGGEATVDQACLRVLRWKQALGLLEQNNGEPS